MSISLDNVQKNPEKPTSRLHEHTSTNYLNWYLHVARIVLLTSTNCQVKNHVPVINFTLPKQKFQSEGEVTATGFEPTTT